MNKQINRPQDLDACRAACKLAMDIFRASKLWPAEERLLCGMLAKPESFCLKS